jgi:hypothetical protein
MKHTLLISPSSSCHTFSTAGAAMMISSCALMKVAGIVERQPMHQ